AVLAAAREAGHARAVGVRLAWHGRSLERITHLVPAEAAENVRLVGEVGGARRRRARAEHEVDGQRRADHETGRGRAVVARRIRIAQRRIAGRAGEAIVRAAVADTRRRVADRTRLDERIAGPAGTVVVRDAAKACVGAAHAPPPLAGAADSTVRCRAPRRVRRLRATLAPPGVVLARAAARPGGGGLAGRAGFRAPAAAIGQQVAGQEEARTERQLEVRHRSGRAVGRALGILRDADDETGARGCATVAAVRDRERRLEEAAAARAGANAAGIRLRRRPEGERRAVARGHAERRDPRVGDERREGDG